MATAIAQVRDWLVVEGGSTELSEVIRSLPEVCQRAVDADKVGAPTAATYASRVRSAIRETGLGPRPIKLGRARAATAHAIGTSVPPQASESGALTIEQELDEAFAALGRWRHLRARLLPVLSELDKERRRG